MLVYRWEDADGVGPYAAGTLSGADRWTEVPHREAYGRPIPSRDDIEPCGGSYGFASLDQEREWFRPHERWIMLEHGFRLVTYSVDDSAVQIGGHQCEFDPCEQDEIPPMCPFHRRMKRILEQRRLAA